MSLHTEFYDLREKCWTEFEKLVQNGSNILGDLPIVVSELTLEPVGLRTITTCFSDHTEIIITEIIADPNYTLFPKKENEKDIYVATNTIKVRLFSTKEIVDVEPHLNDLQSLCTFVSGGYTINYEI